MYTYKKIILQQLRNFKSDSRRTHNEKNRIADIEGMKSVNIELFIGHIEGIMGEKDISPLLKQYLADGIKTVRYSQADDRRLREFYTVRKLQLSAIPFAKMKDIELKDIQDTYPSIPGHLNLFLLPWAPIIFLSFYNSTYPIPMALGGSLFNGLMNLAGFGMAHIYMQRHDRYKTPVQDAISNYSNSKSYSFNLFASTSPDRARTITNLNDRAFIPSRKFLEYAREYELDPMSDGDLKPRLAAAIQESEDNYERDLRIAKQYPLYAMRSQILFGCFYGLLMSVWSRGYGEMPGAQYYLMYHLLIHYGEWLVDIIIDSLDLGAYNTLPQNRSVSSAPAPGTLQLNASEQSTTSLTKANYWRELSDEETQFLNSKVVEFIQKNRQLDIHHDREVIGQHVTNILLKAAGSNLKALDHVVYKVTSNKAVSKKDNALYDWFRGKHVTATQSLILKKAKEHALLAANTIVGLDSTQLSFKHKAAILNELLAPDSFINIHRRALGSDPTRVLNPQRNTDTFNQIKRILDVAETVEGDAMNLKGSDDPDFSTEGYAFN